MCSKQKRKISYSTSLSLVDQCRKDKPLSTNFCSYTSFPRNIANQKSHSPERVEHCSFEFQGARYLFQVSQSFRLSFSFILPKNHQKRHHRQHQRTQNQWDGCFSFLSHKMSFKIQIISSIIILGARSVASFHY